MSFNTFILAQDTMYDLKIGEMVQASPKKQLKSQFIGIFFGCVAGLALFYGIVSTFGFDGELFTYPFGNMYYAVATGNNRISHKAPEVQRWPSRHFSSYFC